MDGSPDARQPHAATRMLALAREFARRSRGAETALIREAGVYSDAEYAAKPAEADDAAGG